MRTCFQDSVPPTASYLKCIHTASYYIVVNHYKSELLFQVLHNSVSDRGHFGEYDFSYDIFMIYSTENAQKCKNGSHHEADI